MKFKELVKYISEEEGLKESVNIAQISEITRIILLKLSKSPEEALKLLKRYEKKN